MAEFALCLTHDVDRPYKTYQAIYDALAERDLGQLAAFRPGHNPYWQFESLMGLEDDLGVRSAFYFLSEPGLRDRPFRQWLQPRYWIEHLGRYDVETTDLTNIIRALDASGWEVGLHGSFNSFDDRERLTDEKAKIERALDHEVAGGRQHYLNLAPGAATWRHHRAIGLGYDSSLGSSTEYGFQHGYEPLRPFDDKFVVFPLTAMETALVGDGDFAAAWDACEALLAEAADNDAVMTVLWHPRLMSEDFPGYRDLYRRLIERALELDAWVGPPGDLYERLDEPASEGGTHSEHGVVEGLVSNTAD